LPAFCARQLSSGENGKSCKTERRLDQCSPGALPATTSSRQFHPADSAAKGGVLPGSPLPKPGKGRERLLRKYIHRFRVNPAKCANASVRMPLDNLRVSVMINMPCKYASLMFAWVSFGQLNGSASGRPEGALIN
jgi:hypothetical protein